MEIRHLQTFAAAAECESFTRAASTLQLTQAAVSQQIAALEKQLEVELFSREGRGVRLSEPGRRLYSYARQILDLVDQALLDVGSTPKQIQGRLRIASSTVPAEWLIPELLAGFRERWPEVSESLAVSDSRVAAAAVAAGEADLGFVGELPRSSELQAQPVIEDELALFVSSTHPLASKGATSLKALRREAMIMRESGSGTRRCVEQALEEQGVSPADLNLSMEANTNDAIRAAIKRGVGVGFLSKRENVQVEGLVLVKVRGFRPRRQLYLIQAPKQIPGPPARQFLTYIKDWRAARAE